MDEYIKRDDAINGFVQMLKQPGDIYPTDITTMLQSIPPADVRPVVLCRDCKHSHMTYGGECKYCDFLQEDGGDALYLPKDFFCAAGERKDSDG